MNNQYQKDHLSSRPEGEMTIKKVNNEYQTMLSLLRALRGEKSFNE